MVATVNRLFKYLKMLTIMFIYIEAGVEFIDLGCGTGSFCLLLAKMFPKTRLTGVDYSRTALEHATRQRQNKGLTNISFEFGDAHKLPESWTSKFDIVFVFYVLHDLPDPHKAISEIHRILKPDGFLVVADIGVHSNPIDNIGDANAAMCYSLSSFSCLPNSLSGESTVGYGTCWGMEKLEEALTEGKFSILGRSKVDIEIVYICKKV